MERNPLTAKPLEPTVLTIFGMSGHLSQTKLLPALYHLLAKQLLPEQFAVVGIFRSSSATIDTVMQQVEINLLRKHQDVDPAILKQLRQLIHPVTMDSTNHQDYTSLRQQLDDLDTQAGTNYQRLFYLAIPPDIFSQVIDCLAQSGLSAEDNGQARRLLVEKPFGTNLESARQLVNTLSGHYGEQQIYRIDHYLAKENAQNLLTFRFGNPLIEGIWSRQFIDHIQITAAEAQGIDARSSFYEGMGALRDFLQSHLMNLLALTTMEAPANMSSDAIHAEKLRLLQEIQPIKQNHVDELAVRGQYQGYRDEVQNPKSITETYAAVCLEINNSRWGGVPILLRTGKHMPQSYTDIKLVFKERSSRSIPANILTVRIQPNEGIAIKLTAKQPGFGNELQPVDMQFNYQDSFDGDSPDAYERVLIDAMAGDQSLFASSEEVLRSWEILEPVLEYWNYNAGQPEEYAQGSTGPEAANALAKSFGTDWL